MEKFLKSVTFCMTSCNRNDLLFKTFNSFIATNADNYYIAKWLIKEDSGIESVAEEIRKKYPFVEVISGKQLGQCESIDTMYNLVKTDYIFHCEEDWYFEGNSKFLEQSLQILEAHPDIHQVWIRKNVQNWTHNYSKFEDFMFGYIKDKHLDMWNGFSWNPGLRRLSDYKTMFPNGFKEFSKVYKSGAPAERECMLHTRNFNYKAAILKDCVCDHTGSNRSTTK